MANVFNQIGQALSRPLVQWGGGELIGSFLNKTGVITLSCDGDTLVFPVVPSEFGVSVSTGHGTVNIINAGDYAMIGKTGLKSVKISSFFPAQKYTFSSGDTDPYNLVEQIEEWRTGTKPLHISVEDSPINFDCLIASFSYKEQDGSGDVYFDLSLTEYRHIEETVQDKNTGLKNRPNAWQRIAADTAVGIARGESPMRAVKKAIKRSGKESGGGYLSDYRNIVRHGGVSEGDVLLMTAHGTSINGKMI